MTRISSIDDYEFHNFRLIEEINQNVRIYIKTRRDNAIDSLRAAMNANEIDGINIALMNSAYWIRVDLELLLRTVFWANRTDDELRARVVFDQKEIPQKIRKRLDLKDDEKVDSFITLLENRQNKLPQIKSIESNTEILKDIIWHKDRLKKLYDTFYIRLTKLTHPDPYFTFMDANFLKSEGENFTQPFNICAGEIDREWCDLEKKSVESKKI
jgi:hypothetical protein